MVSPGAACAQVAVQADVLWTMAGEPIENGVVLIGEDGKIEAVGAGLEAPAGYEVKRCAVAVPGLVDVRSTVGLTGIYNVGADQDQFDTSSPIQPALRAVDAYNPRDRLVSYLRSFGVTTVHTGHAPGELVSGQTMIVKTRGGTVGEATVEPLAGVAATLSPIAEKGGGKSPGTRAKMMEMLRGRLVKAQEYMDKQEKKGGDGQDARPTGEEEGDGQDARPTGEGEGEEEARSETGPTRDLEAEALGAVLRGEVPLIVTANRSQDIANALRLADEFGFRLWLDMGAEAYLHAQDLAERGVPVLLHPTMFRSWGDTESLSFETAKVLDDAGVVFAIQSGYEGYVPKVRVVLFEAGAAAGVGGLGFERALRAVTIDAAEILGIADRVGSLEVGKDGDVAMYDGDPFEYTTHCVGAVIEGEVFGGEREFEMNYP